MKCKNCGYEIEKPNQRTCPCCGQPIEQEEPAQRLEPITPLVEEQEDVQEKEEFLDSQTKENDLQLTSKCPRCGTLLRGSNFCPNCGCDLREPMVEEKTEEEYIPVQEFPEMIDEALEPEPFIYTEPEEEDPIEEPPYREEETPSKVHTSQRPDYSGYYDQEPDNVKDHGYDTAIIEDDGQSPIPSSSDSDSSWLIITLAGIGSILLGCLLYIIF